MDMTLQTQIEQCAPAMNRALMSALVRRESNGNPFAIGMDGTAPYLAQPKTLAEAVATAEGLKRKGKTFSVGLAQIHVSNIKLLGLPWTQAFDGCTSLRNGQKIFDGFYKKAIEAGFKGSDAVFAALRGYNSGSVFAAISNKYASAIMAGAGGKISIASHDVQATVTRLASGMSEHSRSESAELFSK